MRAKFIYEKFVEDSDPIRDMGISIFPKGFIPMFILKRKYPGMEFPVGTIFGKMEGWSSFGSFIVEKNKLMYCTGWELETYFLPYVGEFFEKYEK